MDVKGAGYAMFLTNSSIYMIQNYRMRNHPVFKEAAAIKCTDIRNIQNIKPYL